MGRNHYWVTKFPRCQQEARVRALLRYIRIFCWSPMHFGYRRFAYLMHPPLADSHEDYRAIAGSLAADRKRLAQIHAALRPELCASPLFDTRGFARRFELALQRIWAGAPADGAGGI